MPYNWPAWKPLGSESLHLSLHIYLFLRRSRFLLGRRYSFRTTEWVLNTSKPLPFVSDGLKTSNCTWTAREVDELRVPKHSANHDWPLYDWPRTDACCSRQSGMWLPIVTARQRGNTASRTRAAFAIKQGSILIQEWRDRSLRAPRPHG